jgi:hypothetical protein
LSTSPTLRPHVSISQVRRAKARLNPSRPAARSARAQEAVINQWLLEQSAAPKRRAPEVTR